MKFFFRNYNFKKIEQINTIYREIMIIIARKEDLEKGKNRVERNTIGKTQYNNNAYTESGYRKSREAIKRQARALVRILSLSLYGFASSKRARKRGRNQWRRCCCAQPFWVARQRYRTMMLRDYALFHRSLNATNLLFRRLSFSPLSASRTLTLEISIHDKYLDILNVIDIVEINSFI